MLAVVNPKGGVGKTTTTINLGAALAEKGRKVLLVDFDPQGHLTVGCGLQAIYTSGDFKLGTFILKGAVDQIKSFISGVEDFWVMPAHISLIGLEAELIFSKAGESRFKRVLEPLSADYEFCLIDSPPAISILTDSALIAARRVLVPIQAEDTSIRGVEALERNILDLKDILDVDIELIAIVPNMVTTTSVAERILSKLRNIESEEASIFQRIRRRWPNVVTEIQIRKRVDLVKAWHEGKSIFTYNPRCDVVDSYRRLSDLVASSGTAI